VPLPADSDGVPRIPAGTALIRKNAMAGGVGWGREADGTPILGGDPTVRFDSKSPDDWEIVGNRRRLATPRRSTARSCIRWH
jgi:hypothetical protein